MADPKRKPAAAARFALGALVRVKRGVADPDCPIMPLGGWVGSVAEIDAHDPPMYRIVWTSETLSAVHPIYKVRCQRAELDETCMWLDDESLDAHAGPPADIEAPSPEAISRVFEQDDRVKDALASPREGPIPHVTDKNLMRYFEHLKARLTFPFEGEDIGSDTDGDVTVVGIVNPATHDLDPYDGLLCDCRQQNRPGVVPLRDIEVKHDAGNRQLIEDYVYWLGTMPLPYELAEQLQRHLDQDDIDQDDVDQEDLDKEDLDQDDADWRDDTSLDGFPDEIALEETDNSFENVSPRSSNADAPREVNWHDAPQAEDDFDMGLPLERAGVKVGRNDPCPCGSGLKFKKCCLKRHG